jgi:hypothetical protein
MLVFFIIEVSVAMFWWQTAQKAVEIGTRVAVVTTPAASGIPAINLPAPGVLYGTHCDGGACQGWDENAEGTCIGGVTGCNPESFDRIVGRMRDIFAVIEDEHVSITYTYVGLGFAGGPVAPAVSVTLSGIPFETGFASILGNFIGGGSPLLTVPDISVTLTGEDLETAGVS